MHQHGRKLPDYCISISSAVSSAHTGEFYQILGKGERLVPRPTFLVVETEPEYALSTRKLVLETAKFNVITAHSWTEARELLSMFPRAQAVIVSSEIADCGTCREFIAEVKKRDPEMMVIVLSPTDSASFANSDFVLPSFEPEVLVAFLRQHFGDPRTMPTPSNIAES